MNALEELEQLLRPAAGGIYTVSAGSARQAELQCRLYGAVDSADVVERWRDALTRITDAAVLVLGVPSDVGAGFARGAAFGPQAIREGWLSGGPTPYRADEVLDVGDVRVVPQLLTDEMLDEAQLARTRRALYGDLAQSAALPVSPLSIAERAIDLLRELAPTARILVLGGDHSVAWPAVKSLARGRETTTGILHVDAHTDLLEERLGVRYCFATWAFHANALIGANKRLAQVGVRVSRKDKTYWQDTLGVAQYWADEINNSDADAIANAIVADFQTAGVRDLYISNDIDGTDPEFAAATGTPESNGLAPDTVVALIEKVSAHFNVIGSDLVEVAPVLAGEQQRTTTIDTACRYGDAQLRAMLA